MKKNGFTLIELLAVMAIIIIVVGLGAPTLINVLKSNKEKAQEKTIEIIESAARSYAIDYGESAGTTICISTLCSKEYLSCPINNAVDDTVMDGCVIVTKNANNIESYSYNSSITENVMINLTIDLDGGSIETDPADSYYVGSNITLTNPIKANFTFAGWLVTSGNSTVSGNDLAMGTEDTIIKALWNENIQLSVDLDGGNIETNPAGTYLSGNSIILPMPTKANYIFAGWNVETGDSVVSGNDLTIGTENTTIKATWADVIVEYAYTGDVQEFTPLVDGYYKLELWGAQGGNAKYTTQYYGGNGAYTCGNILLNKDEHLYIYVGGQGVSISGTTASPVIQYNGEGYNGGAGSTFKENNSAHGGGAGATDIRYNNNRLIDRIMVAGGGGGASSHSDKPNYSGNGGYGGKLYGGNAILGSTTCYAYGTGGSQTMGGNSTTCAVNGVATSGTGSFGAGAGNVELYFNDYSPAGGGGGYYGGGKGHHAGGGGGSSYISGYSGCIAVTSAGNPKSGCTDGTTDTSCSIHYSNKVFTDMEMKAGNELIPTHDGISTMTGNSGNGYAKITYIASE